jgi:hypothetical protein
MRIDRAANPIVGIFLNRKRSAHSAKFKAALSLADHLNWRFGANLSQPAGSIAALGTGTGVAMSFLSPVW